jgi:hypothetical protein
LRSSWLANAAQALSLHRTASGALLPCSCLPLGFQDASLQDRTLPEDILENVAAWLPIQELLGSFSLASRSTHAAAVAVTGYVSWWPYRPAGMDSLAYFKDKAASLSSYLSSNGRAVKHVSLAPSSKGSEVVVPIPWQALTELQSFSSCGAPLSISSSIHAQRMLGSSMPKDRLVRTAGAAEANSAPPGSVAAAAAFPAVERALSTAELMPSAQALSWLSLGALTALTSLELTSCGIEGCCDVCAWLASQLTHLPRLRDLELVGIQAPYTSAGAAALVSRLQQLQELTRLCLKADRFGVQKPPDARRPCIPCPALNSLTQLRSVDLEKVGTSSQPLDLGKLPDSLTALSFENCDVSYSDTSSSSASSCAVQQPLLQQLDVSIVSPEGNPGGWQPLCLLLRQASALSKLKFVGDCGSFLDRASGVLSQLQSLQHIDLHNDSNEPHDDHLLDWDPEADQLAALASCSQLTTLKLGFRRWPAGAVQHLFSAGQQLQRLQGLSIALTAKLEPGAGWQLEPGDISCIVACCPNLRCLCSRGGYWWSAVGVGRISTSELQQLRQLTALSTLSIASPRWVTQAAAVLADMTGGCMAVNCCMYSFGGCSALSFVMHGVADVSCCDNRQLISLAAV